MQLRIALHRRAVNGVVTKSILTVGDAVGSYRMVGVPDGLGAFDNGDGTFTVLLASGSRWQSREHTTRPHQLTAAGLTTARRSSPAEPAAIYARPFFVGK